MSDFVDQVLAATGADKVEIVGHSQGGMMPRYYMRFLGGDHKAAGLVGLAPSNHGTTLGLPDLLRGLLVPVAGLVCPACADQAAGSPFLTRLNADGDVDPGVKYTVIATRYDESVVPYTSSFLAGPSSQVTNITLQDKCPLDFDDHVGLAFDQVVTQLVLNALSHDGRAQPGFQPDC